MLSAGVPATYAEKITIIANSLGITRNKLLVMAIDAGLPAAIAQAQAGTPAAPQQQG